MEVHGDWRTATRLYGSGLRRLLSPPADALGALALRRADSVRTLSPFTTGLVRDLGVEPASAFPAFVDLTIFLGPVRPLPERPRFLFVGVLERYKNVEGLVAAWRLAARRIPDAILHVVGSGRDGIGSVKTGDTVNVAGIVDGGKSSAAAILDSTGLGKIGEHWGFPKHK